MRGLKEPVADPELKRILDNFSSLFRIRIAFFQPDGSEYEIGEDREISDYCRCLRTLLNYDGHCRRLDRSKLKKAAETEQLQSYVCHGGCWEAVKPILQDGELLGFVMIGQSARQDNIPGPVLKDAEQAGVGPYLQDCFNRLPHYDKGKMNSILELFSELTDLILLKNLIRRREMGPVNLVIEHLKEKVERLSLAEASAMAGMSESRFRHRFREETGLSFTEYKTSVVMNRAARILCDDTEITIQELSESLKYGDPLYFSRAFRKFHGCSPGQYRRRINRS